jgi:hypothetical protein
VLAAYHLVKLIWNREYAQVWPHLKDSIWSGPSIPLVQALSDTLHEQVADAISNAYSCIRLKRACELLGTGEEALVQGATYPSLIVEVI